jgi:hypothetical protein
MEALYLEYCEIMETWVGIAPVNWETWALLWARRALLSARLLWEMLLINGEPSISMTRLIWVTVPPWMLWFLVRLVFV